MPSPTPGDTALLDSSSSSSATLPLLPGHSPHLGYCLQSSLFFHSVSWSTVLRSSVSSLLSAFASDVEAQGAESQESPFQLFQKRWEGKEEGWYALGVVGCMAGGWRADWARAVVRGFLEHLLPSSPSPPLHKAGALFALYAFWSTQVELGSGGEGWEKVWVEMDVATMDYILSLSSLLPSLLAPSSASTSSPPSSSPTPLELDLSSVLLHLLKSSAFHLIPSPTFMHPPLPSVEVREARRGGFEQAGKGVLGVEEEMGLLVDGRVMEVEEAREGPSPKTVGGKRKPDGEWDDEKGWGARLRGTRETYLASKGAALASFSSVDSSADSHQPPPGKRPRLPSPSALPTPPPTAPSHSSSAAPKTAVESFKSSILLLAQSETLSAISKMDQHGLSLPSLLGADGGGRKLLEMIGEGAEGGDRLERYEGEVERLGRSLVESEEE